MAGTDVPLKEKVQVYISRSPLRKPITSLHVWIYRLTNGKLGRRYRALPVLLLTTTGRKTGKKRTWPVAHMVVDGNYIVTASNAGKDKHPSWYFNLKRNPQGTIQVGSAKKKVLAKEATQEEEGRLWPMLVKLEPHYGEYQEQTTRDIPMMILQPQNGSK